MNPKPRFSELMSRLLDDALTDDEVAELASCLHADPALRSQLVDHLLLDTLLDENLGQEPLTSLVDLMGVTANQPLPGQAQELIQPLTKTQIVTVDHRRRSWMSGWLMAAASLLLVVLLFNLQGEKEAFASVAQVVQAAMQTHAQAIERVYVVEVLRGETGQPRLELPRDVRVATQGDRFWVQMNGIRKWTWGRDGAGAMWLTLGQRRAVVLDSEEMGAPLRYIGDLYSLNLETLLQSFLKHCQLEMSDGPGDTTMIVATPRQQWSNRPLKRATIEIDRETKAIRKLVIEREFDRSSSIATFTLVESR
ncbi:MAG: hypothetical protein IT423_22515 [Pirellulaceae bacterium]|nr:hypothetical protein [Pirellulaceae bacterium]